MLREWKSYGIRWILIAALAGCGTESRAPAQCDDCIALKLLAELGDSTPEGYVENTYGGAVDSSGRYWLGVDGGIKVYNENGSFYRQVGREGQGPLEFDYAEPVFTDARGHVHVFDPGNARESVLDSQFRLLEEKPLIAVSQLDVAAMDESTYVLNALLSSGQSKLAALHLVRSGQVAFSFADIEIGTQATEFDVQRIITTDLNGRIFAASRFEYTIEMWLPTGRRLAAIVGPQLNDHSVKQIPYNLTDNPIPNEIMALQSADSLTLWVVSRRRRDTWRTHLKPRIFPGGLAGVQLKPGSTHDSLYYSRVDLFDISTQKVIATRNMEGHFTGFIGRGLLLENRANGEGNSGVAIWRIEHVRGGTH